MNYQPIRYPAGSPQAIEAQHRAHDKRARKAARRDRGDSLTAWYIAHTKPRCEFEAAYHLQQAGYRAWAPYCFATTRHARKEMTVRRPVLTRYVFIGAREEQGLWDAQHARGVAGIVMFGENAAEVPNRVMRALMAQCDSDGWMRMADDKPDQHDYQPGDRVKVVEGPLEGFVAQVKGLDGMDDLELEVEMFGARRPVKVAASRVTAAK